MADNALRRLFGENLRLVNVGLASFAEPPAAAGAPVVTLDWRPPAGGDPEAGLRVARLSGNPSIGKANAEAVERLLSVQPVLKDVLPAAAALGLERGSLLHAGPPIEWEAMCGPMRGAVIGAVMFEGWATSPEDAVALAASGGVRFSPAHDRGAVGPMAGVISPSMPVWVVEDAARGTSAFSNLNEGLGKALRFGAFDAAVLERLRWMAKELGPLLSRTLRALPEPVNLKAVISQALLMGDECHNRNVAATSLLARKLAPALVTEAGGPAERALAFMRDNDHFFLNLSMAACKLGLQAAHGLPGSSLVTAMARNGVEFGIRISGCGARWFTAPSTVPDGLYFPGYSPADANPDLGDSAITETAGLGGFAMAAAPAIVGFVGGTPAEATGHSVEMATITLARNPEYQLPALGFAGSPTGIDARLVADSGTLPVINTGIAHREPGVGQIGAGIARAPLGCFLAALKGLEETL